MIVKTIQRTCDACPSQWHGETDTGEAVYVRYRHGYLRAEVGDSVVLGAEIGDSLDGYMTDAEMMEHTKEVLNFETANWLSTPN